MIVMAQLGSSEIARYEADVEEPPELYDEFRVRALSGARANGSGWVKVKVYRIIMWNSMPGGRLYLLGAM